jgi:3'-phosphoadenosine 5'-phosphosulfate sulfotransferase (PAPS reductase)/FAD synthetase
MSREKEQAAVRSAGDWPGRVAAAHAVIDEAIATEKHPVTHLFALFSGGHDSLTSVHVTASHPAFTGVVHINTGIGVEETREFVRETCTREGWPLLEYHPPVPYRDIVVEHGFPGPAGHLHMYRRLKERSIRLLIKDHKVKRFDRIGLVTGVRTQESTRRMAHVQKVQRDGAQLWIAPIYDWSKADCTAYIDAQGLKRNEVADTMHMSCECLCGAFARPDEMQDLELWYPETAKQIHALEAEVAAAGHKACVWGKRPPKLTVADLARERIDTALPLCTSCVTDRLLADGAA